MKLFKKIGRILEQPKVLWGKINKIDQTYCFYCLTVKEFIPNIKTIIDVGSNKGNFIKASKFIFPYAKIYSFEPNRKLYNKTKNMENVKSYNFGLWNNTTSLTFNFNPKFEDVSSFMKRTNLHSNDFNLPISEIKQELKVKRFDELDINIQKPCFLKIDTEGADYKVLEGFGDKLKEIDVIQIEYFPKKYYEGQSKMSEIITHLEKYGFNSFIQKAVQIKDKEILYYDLIFFKNKN